ncbi:MAG: hypothetical protein AABY63_04235, partial [candidate division NC10 bacterium]
MVVQGPKIMITQNTRREASARREGYMSLREGMTFELERKVTEAEKEVSRIRDQYQLNIVSSSGGTDSALTKMALTQLENSRIQASLDMQGKKTRYEKFV